MTILKVRSFLSKSSHLTFGKEKEMLKQSCMAVESSLAEYPCTERQFNFQKTITLNLINFTWNSSCISKYFKSTV